MCKSKQDSWNEQRAAFYVSGAWIACSRSYRKAHPLCERCLKKGEISPAEEAHHRIKLTPQNINNPDITLNWDNMESLCSKCHKEEHNKQRSEQKKSGQRWRINADGDVVFCDTPLGA